jgi:hypothetical protein
VNMRRLNDEGEYVPFNVVPMEPQRARRITPTPGYLPPVMREDEPQVRPIPWAVPLAVHWLVAFALGVIVTAVVTR